MTSFTSPVYILSGVFIVTSLIVTSAPRAREHLHSTNPCTKRKVISLNKPKGKYIKRKMIIYFKKTLRNYITLVFLLFGPFVKVLPFTKNGPKYLTKLTSPMFIYLMRFLLHYLVSVSFFVLLESFFLFFLWSLFVWRCPLPVLSSFIFSERFNFSWFGRAIPSVKYFPTCHYKHSIFFWVKSIPVSRLYSYCLYRVFKSGVLHVHWSLSYSKFSQLSIAQLTGTGEYTD